MQGAEAHPEGLSRGRELRLLIPVHDDRRRQAAAQVVALGLQVGQLAAEAGHRLLLGTRVQIAQDPVRLTVEGLAVDAALPGVVGNSALGPIEDDRGASQAGRRQWSSHGSELRHMKGMVVTPLIAAAHSLFVQLTTHRLPHSEMIPQPLSKNRVTDC
jgi:hypothetical protein